MSKALQTAILVVGVVVAFLFWKSANDAAVTQRALSQARADSLKVGRDKYTADSARWAHQDTVAMRQIATRTVFVVKEDSATRLRADSLSEALRRDSTASEDFKGLVRRTVAGLTASRDTLLAISAAKDTVILGLRTQLAKLAELDAATNRALTLERQRASPGLLQKVASGLPYLAAGIVIGKML